MTRILEVFWFDFDRQQIGVLLTDGASHWCAEMPIREAWEHRYWMYGDEQAEHRYGSYVDDLRGVAHVQIYNGEVSYAAH